MNHALLMKSGMDAIYVGPGGKYILDAAGTVGIFGV